MLKHLFAILVAGVTIAVPVPANACECFGRPVCDTFWTADLVFVGRVERITVADSRHQEAHLRIERWLRGEKAGPRIVIDVRGVGISCDAYSFEEGRQYLVYAAKGATGEWRTPLCGGTRPLESAAEDLEYARSALRGLGTGRVSGFAFLDEMPAPHAQWGPPLLGAQLTLASAKHRYTATTDQEGN